MWPLKWNNLISNFLINLCFCEYKNPTLNYAKMVRKKHNKIAIITNIAHDCKKFVCL